MRHILSTLLTSALLLSLAPVRVASADDSTPPFGEIYKGGVIVEPLTTHNCFQKYTYEAKATIKDIADFYVAKAAAVNLSQTTGTAPSRDPGWDLLSFGERPAKRLLIVSLSTNAGGVKVGVAYTADQSTCH